jgi:hypothetical protein
MNNPHPKGVRDPNLTRYWTKGPGLARWSLNPHPYTALANALRSEGVPERFIGGLTATYFRKVFGIWPSQRPMSGKNKHHG